VRNAHSFVTLVPSGELRNGVWDPHTYRYSETPDPTLGEFVRVSKPRRSKALRPIAPFAALEYRHIPSGSSGAFALEPQEETKSYPTVHGESLLFGTMRAYLGNVVVTPDPAWLGFAPDATFGVKSEFLVIEPLDGLVYFWGALLRSRSFLLRLPPGGGGTRPRLEPGGLLGLPVVVGELAVRERVNETLRELAKQEWSVLCARQTALVEAGF